MRYAIWQSLFFLSLFRRKKLAAEPRSATSWIRQVRREIRLASTYYEYELIRTFAPVIDTKLGGKIFCHFLRKIFFSCDYFLINVDVRAN